MKFTFENLGFVSEGDVELGNLTIICGKNNTGKTYISHSIHGLLKKFVSTEVVKISDDKMEELYKNGHCTIDLLKDVPSLSEMSKDISQKFSKSGLSDIFNGEKESFKESKVELELANIPYRKISADKTEVIVGIGEENKLTIKFEKEKCNNYIDIYLLNIDTPKRLAKFTIENNLTEIILSELVPNSFIITSERTGAAMFYKDLDSSAHALLDHFIEMKDSKSFNPFKMMNRMRSRYSLPIRENIDILRYSQEKMKESSFLNEDDHTDILKKLRQIVGGSYSTLSDGIYYNPIKERGRKKVRVPIHLASSATKSLFLIDLYIKNLARENDILIIDEPELNLHPNNQRLVAHLLVRLIKSGIKVVVTTHSDHFLREINSLVMLSNKNIDDEDRKDILDRYNLENSDILEPSDIKAYVNSSKNHKIHPMKVDEYGIHLNLFNEEILESSNLSQEVYSYIL